MYKYRDTHKYLTTTTTTTTTNYYYYLNISWNQRVKTERTIPTNDM